MTPSIPITEELETDLAHLDLLRHAWSAGPPLPPEALARMRDAARIQSIAASCRIGGLRIREELAASILRGDSPGAPEAAEVVGYAAAMEMKFPRGDVLVPDDLRRLNAVVMGDTSPDPPPIPYREIPLHLEAFDDEGRALGRVFQTLPPRLLPEKVDDLVTWLELELRTRERHPLLVIGTFMLGCTAASPFERCSGRTIRAAIVHLLRREGYVHLPYASFEHVIEERREGYYEAIDSAMTRFWSGEADLTGWLTFFVQSLRRHASRISARVEAERQALDLPPLQRAILEMVREHGVVAPALLIARIGTNRNTLKENLTKMVRRGLLERSGMKRGTTYRLGPAVELVAPDRGADH